MPASSQPSIRRYSWRGWILALSALPLLAGCANGDFGEVRPFLVTDEIHDWVGYDAVAGKQGWPSTLDLTDDERQLRDLAYPLIEPPYDRQKWYSVLGEYGLIGYAHRGTFDRTAYAERLLGSYHRSPASRYAQLIDDIRNDNTRLPQFYETAGRVLDIDRKRRASLAYVSALSPSERTNALRRVRENACIVFMVNEKLAERVSAYQYALERLVISTPSPQAADAEFLLKQLQAQVAHYRVEIPPTWVREQSLAAAN
jgi:hypothetical protein